jgi:hypothetical protein
LKDSKNSSQAFVFLSHKSSDDIVNCFNSIKKSTVDIGDSFFLFHDKGTVPENIKVLNPLIFSENVLTELKYTPITNGLIPGSGHFPLFKFFLNYPDYKYYWYIENDVRFNGDWRSFFDTFSSIQKDLIAFDIRRFIDEPDWYWWNSLKTDTEIPQSDLRASFNVICRISNPAMKFIHKKLLSGCKGHHEVLIPTLLNNAGYTIVDFTDICDYFSRETVRPTPHFLIMDKLNKLYHPIKL